MSHVVSEELEAKLLAAEQELQELGYWVRRTQGNIVEVYNLQLAPGEGRISQVAYNHLQRHVKQLGATYGVCPVNEPTTFCFIF